MRGLSSVSGKANQLGFYEVVFGDYREMFKEVDRVEAVTAADVQRVATDVPRRRASGRPSSSCPSGRSPARRRRGPGRPQGPRG